MNARVHALMASSAVNGPGTRAVIWFQGCTLACPDCWNPDTHSPSEGEEMPTTKLLNWVGAIRAPIEGVTFSGGEPMQQAPALLELILLLRRYAPFLGLGMFSGFSERELETNADWFKIRQHLDFAVLGRFNKLQPSDNPLQTSTNQVLRLYSRRYTASDFGPQTVEIQIGTDGLVQLTGFPVRGF